MIQFPASVWSDLLAQPTEAGRATVLAGKFPSGATIEFLDATAAVIRTVTTGAWTVSGAQAIPGTYVDGATGGGTPAVAVFKAGATEIMRMGCEVGVPSDYTLRAPIVENVPIRRGPFAVTFPPPPDVGTAVPSVVSAPSISGSATVGSTLVCTPGVYAGNPTPTVTRQWYKSGTAIAGETGLTYTTVDDDNGASATCVETAENAVGSVTATSNEIGPIVRDLTAAGIPSPLLVPKGESVDLAPYIAGGTPPYFVEIASGSLPAEASLAGTVVSATNDAVIDSSSSVTFKITDSEVVTPTASDIYDVWDGTSGTRYLYWDQAAKLAWTNPNGDWLDANQQKQGATAYDAKTITATGAVTFTNVGALVARWLANGENRGFYLRATSGDWRVDFAGRLSANPPVLTVVTSDGTFTPACTATAYWTHNFTTSYNGQQTFIVQKDGRSAIVQFDLSGVTGTVISASLAMTCTYRNANTVVSIFEADPPGFMIGGNYDAPGFAANYVLDSGIHAHPSVIATLQDWDWTAHTQFFDLYDGSAEALAKTSFGTELDGTKYIRLKLAAGTQDIPTFYKYFVKAESNFAEPTLILQRDALDPNGQWAAPSSGLPVHDELYVRHRIMIEDDWKSTVDGGKMPGFDGRMGRWELGKWQNVGGNSSNDSLGIKRPYSTGWAFEGHSVRGTHYVYYDTGNPNAELFPYGVYLYSLDSGYYDGIERFGNAVLTRGEWYSIEWRMKMNTVSGPADEYGNKTANYDGILQCWCDGTLVYSRNDIRWRRHPLLSVAAYYFAMYHGGTANSPIDMHVRFANMVVSTQYIGPVRKS